MLTSVMEPPWGIRGIWIMLSTVDSAIISAPSTSVRVLDLWFIIFNSSLLLDTKTKAPAATRAHKI